jgi:hypothetical protein
MADKITSPISTSLNIMEISSHGPGRLQSYSSDCSSSGNESEAFEEVRPLKNTLADMKTSSVLGYNLPPITTSIASNQSFQSSKNGPCYPSCQEKRVKDKCLIEFILFPKLPPEIRAMIWRLTLEPRIVQISFCSPVNANIHSFYSETSTPVALKTCQDSRNAVATSYQVCTSNNFVSTTFLFNFSIDTLFFPEPMDPHLNLFFAGLKNEDY